VTTIAIGVETKVETAAIDTAETTQLKTLIADATETTTAVIAGEDRAITQDKGTDHDLQFPNDGGTQSPNRHLLQSRAALCHHKTINSVAKWRPREASLCPRSRNPTGSLPVYLPRKPTLSPVPVLFSNIMSQQKHASLQPKSNGGCMSSKRRISSTLCSCTNVAVGLLVEINTLPI
jgi:hypothetical protein